MSDLGYLYGEPVRPLGPDVTDPGAVHVRLIARPGQPVMTVRRENLEAGRRPMTRLHFYRGVPDLDAQSWSDRWPCTAVLVSLALMVLALAGLGAVCLLLDSLTKGG